MVNIRLAALFLFGFASALPLPLLGSSLTVWLAELGFAQSIISLFALLHIPYSLKVCWVPVVDYCPIPFCTKILGQRRAWALCGLLMTMASLLLAAWIGPENGSFLFSLAIALASLSTGCVYVAGIHLELESIEPSKYAAGSASVIMGYRLGLFFAGAGSLYLADYVNWPCAYTVVAGGMFLGIIAVLAIGKMPESDRALEERQQRVASSSLTRTLAIAYDSWLYPLIELVSRRSVILLLVVLLFYRLSDNIMASVLNPFFLEIGFSKSTIASATKVVGVVSALSGTFLGGLLSTRIGLVRSLFIFGLLHTVSFVLYAFLAENASPTLFFVSVAVEHASRGMMMPVVIALLWRMTSPGYAAVQYTFLWSILSFKASLFSSLGGLIVYSLGWGFFFWTLFFIAVGASFLCVFSKNLYLVQSCRSST